MLSSLTSASGQRQLSRGGVGAITQQQMEFLLFCKSALEDLGVEEMTSVWISITTTPALEPQISRDQSLQQAETGAKPAVCVGGKRI